MEPLIQYRNQIDTIDTAIIELLAQRFEVVKLVGEYKKSQDLPALQPNRWKEVLKSREEKAKIYGIHPDFIDDIWNRIHEYALELEEIEKQKS